MKSNISLLALLTLFCMQISAQNSMEKTVESTVKEVMIFSEGCRITKTQSVALEKGNTVLKFNKLTPYLDEKSVQVKVDQNAIVLSVNFQMNYQSEKKKDESLDNLEKKIDELSEKIKTEQIYCEILSGELAFLNANSRIAGTANGIQSSQLKETYTFYSEKIKELRLDFQKRTNNIKTLSKEKDEYQKQYNEIVNQEVFPEGELYIKVEAPKAATYTFEVSYLADKAGWTPSYDLIAKGITAPIQLIYKAEVHQDTREDWKNAKIKLSSSSPQYSGTAPELIPYFLNYNSRPIVYQESPVSASGGFGSLYGYVRDKTTGESIPFANVAVLKDGKVITGGQTDFDGKYIIRAINPGTYTLQVSCIGFQTQRLQDIVIGANKIVPQNLTLNPTTETLKAVEIVDYKVPVFESNQTSSGAIITADEISKRPSRSVEVVTSVSGVYSKDGDIGSIRGTRQGSIERNQNSNATPMQQIQNETTFEFDIKTPYTIPSDGKNYTIMIDDYMIPAAYQYIAAPRANDNVFLTALLTDWTKYNLLSGVSNIFFENTYIGKTDINPRITSDTLKLSLGSDKGVVIDRQLQKNYSSTKTIGSKTEETKSWKITVKNNKSNTVDLVLTDQIPVSTVNTIEVKALTLSEGLLEEDTGIITWRLSLTAGETKEIELKYVVKYPKGNRVYIE
jgi:hypothetical protein